MCFRAFQMSFREFYKFSGKPLRYYRGFQKGYKMFQGTSIGFKGFRTRTGSIAFLNHSDGFHRRFWAFRERFVGFQNGLTMFQTYYACRSDAPYSREFSDARTLIAK